MIWDKSNECMDRNQLEKLQFDRLQALLERVYSKVPFYRKAFDKAGVKPGDVKDLRDIYKLPFTCKDDLRDNYPFGLFAVPMRDIVRIHSSSGTTGRPTVVGYTAGDIKTWTELIARVVTLAGATPDDVAQIAFGYGLFTGGFGLHYGLERVGATVIPISAGNTARQIQIMKDFGTTVLVSTPSYALHMAEVAKDMGVGPGHIRMRLGLFGSEPWSERIRRELEAAWGILATDNYGLSEVMGPGVAGECPERLGLHINEDHFIPEIVDPETGEPLPPGETGELVFTALTKEAFPVVRYRTRDITSLHYEKCPCGRTMVRMAKVKGRTDDMLIIRGVNVFPSQIETVLMEIEDVEPHYQLVVNRRDDHLDDLEVQVEVPEHAFSGSFKDLENLSDKIKSRIFAMLGLNIKVKLLEPKSLERSVGKAKRVIDNRPKE